MKNEEQTLAIAGIESVGIEGVALAQLESLSRCLRFSSSPQRRMQFAHLILASAQPDGCALHQLQQQLDLRRRFLAVGQDLIDLALRHFDAINVSVCARGPRVRSVRSCCQTPFSAQLLSCECTYV